MSSEETPETSALGWTEVLLQVPHGWAELVAAELSVAPCTTVAFGAPSLGTDPPRAGCEYLRTFAAAHDDTPVWRAAVTSRLTTLAERADAPELLGLTPRFRRLPPEDYANSWKKSWKPFRVGRLAVVTPDWTKPLRDTDVRMHLEPGGAFGTGRHATTRGCLLALQELLQAGDRVLDAGCGSGILAVAAALFGASEVLGFDNDSNARPHAEHLARANGVAERCRFVHAAFDELVQSPALPRAGFDGVLANIYYDVHQAHACDVAAALRPGGWFALSGCPAERLGETLPFLAAAGLEIDQVRARGRWRTLLGRTRR